MNFFGGRFNLYLLALVLSGLLAAGCASDKKDKLTAALRLHLQSSENLSANQKISVLRSEPMVVSIAADPFLTEYHVASAKLIDSPGGFAIEVQFNSSGALMLEQYTSANPGKHLAIFGQWSDKLADGRWLAVPLISHRIFDGKLAFTPDASREESEQFVAGLNAVAKKILKQQLK